MKNELFVRNLPFNTDDSVLRGLFTRFGSVVSVRVPVDRQTGRGRGFGFVEMATRISADNAILELNSSEFGGRQLHVAVSEQQRDGRTLTYGIR